MKNNFTLDLLLASVLMATLLFVVLSSGCGPKSDGLNSPSGFSHSSEIKKEANAPTLTVPDNTRTNVNMPAKHEGVLPPADTAVIK